MILVTEQLADSYIALVKELKWKRVAVISHDDPFNLNVQLTNMCNYMISLSYIISCYYCMNNVGL